MSVVKSCRHTRYSLNIRPCLLDIFIDPDYTSVILFGQMSFISGCNLIFLCSFDYKLNYKINVETELFYHNYKVIKFDELFPDLNRFHRNFGWQLVTPDEKLTQGMYLFVSEYQSHALVHDLMRS